MHQVSRDASPYFSVVDFEPANGPVATTMFRAISLVAVAFKWLTPLAAQSPRNILMISRNKS